MHSILAGRYSATEYADRLAELNSAQWDAVNATESAKDAIIDLNETRIENQIKGIEKEIDAYKELIDLQQDSLIREKELHDYKKSISNKTAEAEKLQREISAMQNDTSSSTIARRKLKEQELANILSEIEEMEYQNSIETQQDALNKQYEAYEETRNKEIDALRESLNDRETILAESFNTVKNNASLVGQEIATIATEHGVTVSNALISSWQSGENAIASYGEVLSQNTSAFIGNIMGVETEIWNLQAQANTTADSLAWMFSTKADNLVNELTSSYYAESNLAYMTQALQDSLVNTLERGYDVSSIVNSLNSIASAANSAKAAVDKLNNSSSIDGFDMSADDLLVDDIGKNVGKGLNEIKESYQRYRLIDNMTGKVYKSGLTYAEAQELQKKDKNVARHTTIEKYANGTRSSKDKLFVTDEEGYELKLPKLSNGQYTLANEGTQVFTKEQTDRLYELSKGGVNGGIPNNLTLLHHEDMMKTWRNASIPEAAINKRISAPVTIDNRTIFNGDINDIKHLKEQMQVIADKSSIMNTDKGIKDFINRIYDGYKYGR